MQKLTGLVRSRQKRVVVAVLVAATLLVANVAWGYYSSQREATARARFALVMSAFTQAVSTNSDKDGFERVITEAQKIKDEYGSLPVAQLAQYYVAISEENLGNTGSSVQNLQALIRDGDPMMKSLAQFALAAIYRNHGDTERAMDVYKDLEESGAISRRESHSGNHSKAARPAGARPAF